MKLRVFINDRNYSSWEFYDFDTNKEINKDTYPKINPLEMKFFAKDIITEDGELVFSHIKTCTYIAGVLLLENNKRSEYIFYTPTWVGVKIFIIVSLFKNQSNG